MVPSEASSRRDSAGPGSGSFTPTWTNATSTSPAGSARRRRFSSEPLEGLIRRVTPFFANALAYRSAARWKLLPSGPVEMVIVLGAAGRTKCSTAQVAAASTSESGSSVTRRSRQETRRNRLGRCVVSSVSMGPGALWQTRARVATPDARGRLVEPWSARAGPAGPSLAAGQGPDPRIDERHARVVDLARR